MPYSKLTDLPEDVQNVLPKHGQEIYRAAFNSAEEQYNDESRMHATAWSAVKNVFHKNEKGNWVKIKSSKK